MSICQASLLSKRFEVSLAAGCGRWSLSEHGLWKVGFKLVEKYQNKEDLEPLIQPINTESENGSSEEIRRDIPSRSGDHMG